MVSHMASLGNASASSLVRIALLMRMVVNPSSRVAVPMLTPIYRYLMNTSTDYPTFVCRIAKFKYGTKLPRIMKTYLVDITLSIDAMHEESAEKKLDSFLSALDLKKNDKMELAEIGDLYEDEDAQHPEDSKDDEDEDWDDEWDDLDWDKMADGEKPKTDDSDDDDDVSDDDDDDSDDDDDDSDEDDLDSLLSNINSDSDDSDDTDDSEDEDDSDDTWDEDEDDSDDTWDEDWGDWDED